MIFFRVWNFEIFILVNFLDLAWFSSIHYTNTTLRLKFANFSKLHELNRKMVPNQIGIWQFVYASKVSFICILHKSECARVGFSDFYHTGWYNRHRKWWYPLALTLTLYEGPSVNVRCFAMLRGYWAIPRRFLEL